MTLPNGISGISDVIGKLFATTGESGLVSGYGLNQIPGMPGLDQNFVTNLLQANIIQLSPGWSAATNALFDGLRRGDPIGGAVSFSLAIVEVFAAQLLDLPLGTWGTVEDALAALEAIPGIAGLIKLLTGVTGTVEDYYGVLHTWAVNLRDIFTGIDLNDSAIDIAAALASWAESVIVPLIEVTIADVTGLADTLAAMAPIDNVVNAITGGSGSGYNLTDLANALTHIPGANLVSVGAGIITGVLSGGNIPGIDAAKIISGVLSGSLIPNLPASIINTGTFTTSLIPGIDASKVISGVLSGSLIPNLPASIINSGIFTQGLIPSLTSGWGGSILSSFLSGTLGTGLIPGIDASKIISGVLSGSLIPNLAASIITSGIFGTGLIPGIDASKVISGAFGQALIPSLTSTWGGTIANANVIGKVSADIGTDISQLISAVTTGAGNATIPGTLANLQSQLNGITSLLGYQPAADPPANSTSGIALTQAAFTAMRAATRPTFLALADSTGDVTFPFPLVGTSATTIPVTQAVPAIGTIGTTDGGVDGTDTATWPLKKSISFCGSKSGTINAIYLTVWRVNTVTGETTWVHTSPNINASVPSAMNRVYYNMANVVDYVPVGQNEYYQIEFRILGTGTFNLVGIPNSWAPANAAGFPTHVGASRTLPSMMARYVGPGNVAAIKNPSAAHVYAVGDTVFAALYGFSNTSAITNFAVTIGGIAMTLIGKTTDFDAASGSFAYAAVYAAGPGTSVSLASLTAGSKTIAVTTTGGGTSGTQCQVFLQSASYSNISAVGAAQFASGTGTVMQQTVTGLTDNQFGLVFSVLISDAGTNFSAANQNTLSTGNMVMQDQYAYDTSVLFKATSDVSGPWGGVAVPMTSSARLLASTTVAAPGFAPSSNLPWFMFGGAAGVSGAAVATHQPTLQTFTSTGVYHRKSWANFYDIITCSGAGGGANGSSLVGGYPGAAGIWNTETVTAADVAGDANWDVIVGNGGFGGSGGTSAGASGFAGGDSYVDIGGYGAAAYTTGGIGGTTNNGTVAGSPGGGPGDIDYNGEPYYGGNGGGSAQASGSQAGGSGAGGNAVFSGNNIYGGNGGDGIAYILAYQ